MRRRLTAGRLLGAVRRAVGVLGAGRRATTGSGTANDTAAPPHARDERRRRGGEPVPPPPVPTRPRRSGAPDAVPPAVDSELVGTRIEYTPSLDGDPDPGEVVWTWVPYEDDPSQGKDRPVVVVGRRARGGGDVLVAVALTSKPNEREPQFDVGTGPWDREGRSSYAKLDRVLDVDPRAVRREGAVLSEARFERLVAALQRHHAR